MVFNVTQIVDDKIEISVIDIETITEELKQFIDENIHQICIGEDGDLSTIKLDLKGRIERWGDQNTFQKRNEFIGKSHIKESNNNSISSALHTNSLWIAGSNSSLLSILSRAFLIVKGV